MGDHNIPVAYKRSTYMVLRAEFTVEPPDGLGSATSATVRGEATAGTGAFVFQGTATVSNGTITLPSTQANVALPNSVQYFNPLTIAWTITPATSPPLSCASNMTTKHRVYVLLGTPNAGSRYETLIHLSCTDALGKANENDTVAAIWNEFTDLDVRRKPKDGFNNPDGQQLTYYANWACVNTTTPAVLANGDGQCGAWAKLFIDIMGAQGINHPNEYVIFGPDQTQVPGAQRFIVNTWSYAPGSGRSGDPTFPYLNLYRGSYVVGNQFSWLFEEVNDQAGVAGQGNPNPNSLFGNHQVVKFGTPAVYYDPSYGVTFGSLADIESGAVGGYVKMDTLTLNEPDFGVDLNGNGNSTDVGVQVDALLFRKNPSGNQLAETTIEYP